ncbi:MAG: DUF4280 domain-containing protein [Flavobacteriaceae bacterium]|nr:DUF4280 domain-containing protein [Flavobacteriaceae bacterium]
MSTGHIAVNGAICECQFGLAPDELVVGAQSKEFINDDGGKKLIANTKELPAPFKAKTFGTCKLQPTPGGYKTCQPNIQEWQDFYDKIELENGGNLLTEKSKAICSIAGTPCIKFTWHGQTAEGNSSNVAQTEEETQYQLNPLVNIKELFLENIDLETEAENKKKQIVSAIWLDGKMNQKISNASIGEKVSLLIETKNYKKGEEISVKIKELNGKDVKRDKKEVVLKGIVNSKGFAELKEEFEVEND